MFNKTASLFVLLVVLSLPAMAGETQYPAAPAPSPTPCQTCEGETQYPTANGETQYPLASSVANALLSVLAAF